MKKRIFSLILVLALLIAVPVAADNSGYVYVAFGDSIAAGYGLSDYSISTDTSDIDYVSMLAGNATLYDLAKSGMRSDELLAYMEDAEVKNALAGADLVTISIGGNDLIFALMKALDPDGDVQSLMLSARQDGEDITIDDVTALVSSLGITNISTVLPAIMTVFADLDTITKATEANVAATVKAIKAISPTATVVVQTVYNPYRGSSLLMGMDSYLDSAFNTLNTRISAGAKSEGAIVADVFTAFKPFGSALLQSSEAGKEYDPHPNYNGHVVIAQTIAAAVKAAGASLPEGRQGLAIDDFTDVKADDEYLEAIQRTYAAGLMKGMGDGTFGGSTTLNRAMVVTMLYRLSGSPEYNGKSVFTDVAAGDWFCTAVNWAAEKGYVSGYGNGLFGPKDEITREQLALILYRYLGAAEKALPQTIKDASGAHDWAKAALGWAVDAGALKVTDSNLRPTESATRAEAANALLAAMN